MHKRRGKKDTVDVTVLIMDPDKLRKESPLVFICAATITASKLSK